MKQKYGDNDNKIVMTSINCFRDCLCCDPKDHQEHSFKLKKGLKCITSEKRRGIIATQIPTQCSRTTETNKFSQIKLNNHIISKHNNKQFRSLSEQSNRSNSPKVEVQDSRIHQTALTSAFKPTPREYFSLQPQQRSYSLQSKPKPTFMQGHIPRTVKARFRYLDKSSEKQNSRSAYNYHNTRQLRQEKPYGVISTIKEVEEDKQKGSSLFQGARSIVSRFVTSRKTDHLAHHVLENSSHKKNNEDVKNFLQNAKLSQTKNLITFTHSNIISESQKKAIFSETNPDILPVSPQTNSNLNYSHFKVGKLLGVGKWAHVYLCQQKETKLIFAMKQIFKESFKMSCSMNKFNEEIRQVLELNHSNLISIYAKFQSQEKLYLVLQYCSCNIYDELKEKGIFPIDKIRKYTCDLVKAIVFLHQNEKIHGSVNIFEIFLNFGQCKLKHSLTECTKTQKNSFKKDVQGLAITVFEMGHGIIPILAHTQTLYQKQKMYKDPDMKTKIKQHMNSRLLLNQTDQQYRQLNDFVNMLLNWEPGCRLAGSICLNHAFLREKKDK